MAEKRKLIHILGGGLWQMPTVKLAKKLGYQVLITDIYQERPCYSLADFHYVIDIMDKERTLEIARKHKIDGIICDTTDVGVPTMAYIAEKLGLVGMGYETAVNFTNKFKMRALARSAGVPSPDFFEIKSFSELQEAVERLTYPFVLKPVDSQSSRGIHVIKSDSSLEEYYKEAMSFSKEKTLIAEGFLDGNEITVESCIANGKVYTIGISEKEHYAHRPEVAKRLTYQAELSEIAEQNVLDVNSRVIKSLGLINGITHAEYMMLGDVPYLVEIAARGGGSHVYSTIVPYLAGMQLSESYLRYIVGDEDFNPAPGELCRGANLAFFDFPTGTVQSINGVEEAKKLPGVKELMLEFSEGDIIRKANDDRSRNGMAVVLGESREDVLKKTAAVFDMVDVKIEAKVL